MKVMGVIGFKNSGKTGLMSRLISELTGRGYKVSAIKHAHSGFDLDQEGRDSYRHRQAGAQEVLISSSTRWALMHEMREAKEHGLEGLLSRLEPCDIVMVEGYKTHAHPKIEARRLATGHPPVNPDDTDIIAIAADHEVAEKTLPVFALDDIMAIADFIIDHLGLKTIR